MNIGILVPLIIFAHIFLKESKKLINDSYPYLCGGTFLVLLLEAKKKHFGKNRIRDTSKTKDNSIAGHQLFFDLIKIFNPEYEKPEENTFKSICSRYISCAIDSSAHLPFTKLTDDGKHNIKRMALGSYRPLLSNMHWFTKKYLDVDNQGVLLRLTKALLELVEKDQSIPDEQLFYAQRDFNPIPKSELVRSDDICLPALLFGIWHFIVFNERENKKGKETYEKWHEKAKEKGAKRKYIGNIGRHFFYPKNITLETRKEPKCAKSMINPSVNGEFPQAKFKFPPQSKYENEGSIQSTVKQDERWMPPTAERMIIRRGGKLRPSKKTELSRKILDIFTKEIRSNEIAQFLVYGDLEEVLNIHNFNKSIRLNLQPYERDVQEVFGTNEEIFFKRLSNFIGSLDALGYYGAIVQKYIKKIETLNDLKISRMRNFEIISKFYREARECFRIICLDNDLSHKDIIQMEGNVDSFSEPTPFTPPSSDFLVTLRKLFIEPMPKQ